MDKKLKDKLKKLLTLANDSGATEAESNTAMLKFQEILALHKLSLSDVDLKSEHDTTEGIVSIGKRPWVSFLYSAACRLCFCTMFVHNKSVIIIGKPSDIESAKCLAEYLIETCSKLSVQFEGTGKRSKAAFRTGFSHRVAVRAIEIVKLAKENKLKNSETGADLILSPLYSQCERDCQNYLKDKGIRIAAKPSRITVGNRDSYSQGASAGNSVHLGTNVVGGGNNNSVRMLG